MKELISGEASKEFKQEAEISHAKVSEQASTTIDGHDWTAQQLEANSSTNLEQDEGVGIPIIIRKFEYAVNPEAFKLHKPTTQELFNAHAKQIEIMLWSDGMEPVPEQNPKVTINKKGTKYRIFVGATPRKGHLLRETPQTLTDVIHTK